MDYQSFLEILDDEYLGNTIKAYLTSVGVLIGAMVLAWIVKNLSRTWLKRWSKKTATKVDDIILELVDWPLYSLIVIVGAYHALVMLHFSERVEVIIHHGMILAASVVVVLTGD